MIQARLTDGSFLIGIDAENVRRIQADKPLVINLRAIGGSDLVIVMYGETMQAIVDSLENTLGPLPPVQTRGEHDA